MRQTLLTPTYNRANLLHRLYLSLKNQTFKDFIWLIVDDGSDDNTKSVVQDFMNERVLNIKYFHQTNQGVSNARNTGFRLAETNYITFIDSDDELLPTAVEDYEKGWEEIEREGKGDIALLGMFVMDEDGKLVGSSNYELSKEINYIDTTWQDLTLKRKCNREINYSISKSKYLECIDLNLYTWNIKKYVSEALIWSIIGKKYKIRLINRIARIYHRDANNSILRNTQTSKDWFLNLAANNLFWINENFSYFHLNPLFFLSSYFHLINTGKKAGISYRSMNSKLNGTLNKFCFNLLYMPFRLLSIILNKY